MVEIKSYPDPISNKKTICASFEEPNTANAIVDGVLKEVVQAMAKRYVEENYMTIASKLDPQAIANLAFANAGKYIAESLLIASRPLHIRDKEDSNPTRRF